MFILFEYLHYRRLRKFPESFHHTLWTVRAHDWIHQVLIRNVLAHFLNVLAHILNAGAQVSEAWWLCTYFRPNFPRSVWTNFGKIPVTSGRFSIWPARTGSENFDRQFRCDRITGSDRNSGRLLNSYLDTAYFTAQRGNYYRLPILASLLTRRLYSRASRIKPLVENCEACLFWPSTKHNLLFEFKLPTS